MPFAGQPDLKRLHCFQLSLCELMDAWRLTIVMRLRTVTVRQSSPCTCLASAGAIRMKGSPAFASVPWPLCGRYPLQLSWQALAEKYLNRLEKLENNRMLKQAFIAGYSLPARLSWTSLLAQNGQLHGHPVSPSTDAATQRPLFSLFVARSHHVDQLSQQTSSKSLMYRSIKIGYACEPYIQQTSNRHLRRILAQFCSGSHWLNIETGRRRKHDRKDRTCPMCTHRIINPGLPPRSLMPLILMRSAVIPLRMSTMPSLIAQLMQMPESNIVIFSRVISPLLQTF